ncbi:MAG TPA: hypothetical protein VGD43_02600, partial [Micromonospora sp.]
MSGEGGGTVLADRGTLRLGLTIGGLLAALLAGYGLGRVETGPTTPAGGVPGSVATGETTTGHTHAPGTAAHSHPTSGQDAGTAGADGTGGVAGLSMTADGFTMVPVESSFRAGIRRDLRFRVVTADGKPVTAFRTVHEKQMHVIVVRRDLTGYQHLHPVLAADGTWSVPLTLATPGVWRAYADFTAIGPDGRETATTLGVDLTVAGDYSLRPLPPVARTATAGGFTVALQGTPQVGASAPVLFRVYADGAPVTGLQPYLGAYGHLVALRDGDLGYLHVHPEPQLTDGAVKFWLTVPGPGRYRLFLDFQVAGVVHTAEFTMTV